MIHPEPHAGWLHQLRSRYFSLCWGSLLQLWHLGRIVMRIGSWDFQIGSLDLKLEACKNDDMLNSSGAALFA